MKSGILILNKGEGMTSQTAVNKVKRLLGVDKAGHTGTLDPLATGVLPILVGGAVKASEFLLTGDKHYRATLLLGETRDTEDVTGTLLTSFSGKYPSEDEVKAAVSSMLGEQFQTPPMYSALKVGGQKLCDLARKGVEVEREARPITVFSIGCERISEREYFLDVHCSKGTYIRTLCADIGKKLGTGGVMKTLERTEAAGFTIREAVTLEDLEAKTAGEREALLYPTEYVFRDRKKLSLKPFFARLARAGQEIYLSKIGFDAQVGEQIALYDDGGFFALGEVKLFDSGIAVKPIRAFHNGS